jgi:hypothetical protein
MFLPRYQPAYSDNLQGQFTARPVGGKLRSTHTTTIPKGNKHVQAKLDPDPTFTCHACYRAR